MKKEDLEKKEKKPIYKRKWFVVLAIFVAIGVIGNMGNNDKKEVEGVAKIEETQPTVSEMEIVEPTQAPTEAPTEAISKEFQNALTKAQRYSDSMYMSKKGIYDQLVSEHGENFPPEAAQYAIDNLVTDYNRNALEKAKRYQDKMAMSNEAIYQQLISEHGEQFTEEEAQYAIDNLE